MSPAPNEWDLARRLDTLSLNIGRHPGGFLVVFLVTSYSSVSPSAPPSLHNSLYFNASFHILGSRLFIGMKSPRTRRGCNTARAFVAGCFAGSGAFISGGHCPGGHRPLSPGGCGSQGMAKVFQRWKRLCLLGWGSDGPQSVQNWGETSCASVQRPERVLTGQWSPQNSCAGDSGARRAGRLAGMGSAGLS